MTYEERLTWLKVSHEQLITKKNYPIEGNGVYERYENHLVRVYYETYNEWWQFKLQAGHWDAINLETLGGENTVSPNYAESGDTFFSFEVTADILAQLTKTGEGWGYSFVINGEGAYIKGISMIHFGATEKVIYEKTTHMSWDDTGRFGLALQYFEACPTPTPRPLVPPSPTPTTTTVLATVT